MENNVIQPYAKILNNVFIWSGNHIGHHSIIKDHVFISSHVVISGNCILGDNIFLGVNSTIIDNLEIEDFTLAGAGSVINKNIPSNMLAIRRSKLKIY